MSEQSPVLIARCPEHGLHGERQECFVCGGPVEQVPMVPAEKYDELAALLDQLSEGDRDLVGFLVREREGIIDRMQEIEHLRGAQSDVRKAAEEVLAGARSFVSSMPFAPPESIGWHFNVKLRDRLAALDAVLSSDPKPQEMP